MKYILRYIILALYWRYLYLNTKFLGLGQCFL